VCVDSPDSWMNSNQFYAGLALAQAMPGPLFNFAAYLGEPSLPVMSFSFLCSAPPRSALLRSAPLRSAQPRSAPLSPAPLRSAPFCPAVPVAARGLARLSGVGGRVFWPREPAATVPRPPVADATQAP
jgi:hypothetical protein